MKAIKGLSGKWLIALFGAAALLLAQPASHVGAATVSAASAVHAQEIGGAEYGLFLQEKYGVALPEKPAKGDFIEAAAAILGYEGADGTAEFSDLKAGDKWYGPASALFELGVLKGPAVGGDQPLTNAVAVSIALRAADLKELAYTYPADKVERSLSPLGITGKGLGAHVAQELAAAVDTGLLPASEYAGFNPKGAVDRELANVLLGKVLESKGLYKQYIGYVYDADIATKLHAAYATSDIIDAPKLQGLVNEALEQELITGYNLKDTRFDSRFIDSLKLTYGHSNLKHAVQLIGLLRSEGLNAKVQFEPKTSAFLHLKEWGDPGPNVVQIKNGNFIAYAKEYDLVFEFANAKDKTKFQDVILAYAKKNEADQTGLIAGSWWQPLYFSPTAIDGYEIITNNLITDPDSPYTVHPFSLNENSEKVIEGLKAIDPDAVITPYQFWVDVPFFNYLHGEAL
ncbi:hypothetical protein A7K91_19335 [Paenibacillus oryzae]|uniref:SLH domain-containing protein n=1 Tax=Paenibacillus oryzae TaxID=1844972 RepID=A0A1A5YP36_9BACL|nr:hypothetical protein [Paenibacillus oryzae]OBR67369.1 hypothetical protein A7K91_19335 [Paenibacillus oryzae]